MGSGARRAQPRWLWLATSGAYFVAGLLVSEWWFGWATEEELQPNVDGLSVDEVQLVSLLGLVAAVVTRIVLARRARRSVLPDDGQGSAQPLV